MKTTCCTESALYAKGSWLPNDVTKCPDRIQRPGYQASQNGCGAPGGEWVPDTDLLQRISFTPCCTIHDHCYQICQADRLNCDGQLTACMARLCADNIPLDLAILHLAACFSQADIYGLAVMAVAGPGFNDAQRQACQCCP